MSRPFYTTFVKIFKIRLNADINAIAKNYTSSEKKILEQTYDTIMIYGLGITTIAHMFYTFRTLKYKMIKVEKKYKFTRNGFTEFMIVDSEGNHYNINNSLWLLKFDSIEDWDKIKTDEPIIVKYYGLRIPLFGLFPNIIMSNQAKTLDLITKQEYRALEYEFNNGSRYDTYTY